MSHGTEPSGSAARPARSASPLTSRSTAKEAAYKAVHPLTGVWAPLAAITVSVHADGTFTVRHPHHPVARIGSWGVHHGTVVTALALPPRMAAAV
ncbi:4'-phosphopantetheinyl transferase superfamily protein [Kitasatospora sp. NPDC091335]|uniref:4'-phosphopantetheinyl transferase family protein n=1 Tax=Kitasatospora sp. NPDC091335 TaxID=3364085 RepID=UPI0037FE04F1